MAMFKEVDEIPKSTRGGGARGSVYTTIVEDFFGSEFFRVEITLDKKPTTILQGLNKAIKSNPDPDIQKYVKALKRGDKVYLTMVGNNPKKK